MDLATRFPNRRKQYQPQYTIDDLVRIVQNFYSIHHRVPTTKDIQLLAAQHKSPDRGTFNRHGGLNWIIEKSSLEVKNKKLSQFILAEEAQTMFLIFVNKFRADNCGFLPTWQQCEKELSLSSNVFKKNTGKTYKEALIGLGAKVRMGKQANLPAGAYK